MNGGVDLSDWLLFGVGFGLHLLWVCLAQFATNPDLRKLSLSKHATIVVLTPLLAALALHYSAAGGLGLFTSSCLSLVVGILAHQGLLVLLSSRHLVMWRLAVRNLTRRRRNTALMIIGLLVGSAMVSSSLVVGDSMDATISAEVFLRQDTSDIEIFGIDSLTGTRMELNESRMRELGTMLEMDPDGKSLVDGFSLGRTKTISVFNNETQLGEPDATWWAVDPQLDEQGDWSLIGGKGGISYSDLAHEEAVLGYSIFVANQVLADAIEAEEGDVVGVSWSTYDEFAVRTRHSENLTLWKILPTQGAGAVEGSKGGALFSTLSTAQKMQEALDEVNLVRISAAGGVDDSLEAESELYPIVERTLDKVLIAGDAGLFVEGDQQLGMISVGRSNAVGRLDGSMTRDLRNYSQELGEDVALSELLQAPLFGIRQSGVPLTGLLSSEISGFISGQNQRWYLHPGGVTHEPSSGDMDVWSTPADALLRSAISNEQGLLVAHDKGLTRVVIDDDAIDFEVPAGQVMGLAQSEDDFHILVLSEDVPALYYSSNLQSWVEDVLPVEALDSAQDGGLYYSDDGLILHLEGLLDVETWVRSGLEWELVESGPHEVLQLKMDGFIYSSDRLQRFDSTPATALGLADLDVISWNAPDVWLSDGSIWTYDGSLFNQTTTLSPDTCDGTAFSLSQGILSCSSQIGAVVVEQGNESIRIPRLTELEGIGTIPLFVIAASGEFEGLPEAAENEVRLSPWLDDAISGVEELTLTGYLAASRGNNTGIQLLIGQAIPPLPSAPGQAEMADVIIGVVNFSTAEILSAASEDERSLLLFTSTSFLQLENLNATVLALSNWLDQYANHEAAGLVVNRAKHDGIETSEMASGSLSALFIVFGSFTMIAGMLLVVNIFVMIAEERKNEMGMVRALGLQRPDLRALFVLEGSLVAAISSAVGSLLGLFVGWLVATAFAWALSSVEGDWSWQSLIAGFAVGFLVSWASLWGTSFRNSRLNVVAAMRNLPPQKGQGPPWWSWLLILALGGASVVCMGWFFLNGGEGVFAHGLWSLTGIFALLSLIPLLFYNLPHVMAARSAFASRMVRNSARNTMAVLGLLLIIWAILPGWLDPVRADLEPDEASFIIIGVSSVAAGVLLLTSLAPMLASVIGRAASITKRIGPVVPTALAYPLSTPFRTALTLGMFSLTVFSVVVLAGYSAQFESYSESFVDDVSGDFDILGTTSSWDRPLPLEGTPSGWDWPEDIAPDEFDGIGVVSLGVVRYSDAANPEPFETERAHYLRGIDAGFADHGGLPLHIWDESLGEDSSVVWRTLATNPNVCILDASFGMEFQGVEDEDSLFNQEPFSIGESIIAIDPENPSIHRELTIIGFLDEGSLWAAPGIWVGHSVVGEEFDARITRLYLSMPEGTTLEEKEEMAQRLERGFIDAGMEVNVIETSVKEFQMIIFAIFDIFQSYLMLGLVVGIAGLGVVTIRAVSERVHQTGVLRAIGFQRRMVVGGYLLELSWISLLGILNGLVVGIGFHWYLYERFWKDEGAAFTLPWVTLLWVVIGAWLLILAATAIPVRRAASIHPAEALREISS
ncbi:MAG: ABC transporter permease [Candidatus Poseidoniaceae archaeon]|nr:ABC transporter permease [Candidatus Poseidoniaceae archaeon]